MIYIDPPIYFIYFICVCLGVNTIFCFSIMYTLFSNRSTNNVEVDNTELEELKVKYEEEVKNHKTTKLRNKEWSQKYMTLQKEVNNATKN